MVLLVEGDGYCWCCRCAVDAAIEIKRDSVLSWGVQGSLKIWRYGVSNYLFVVMSIMIGKRAYTRTAVECRRLRQVNVHLQWCSTAGGRLRSHFWRWYGARQWIHCNSTSTMISATDSWVQPVGMGWLYPWESPQRTCGQLRSCEDWGSVVWIAATMIKINK